MSDKERFIDNQDGTMTDSATGMLWMKEDAWQKEAKWYTWDEAKELANDINDIKLGGFQDWRLPLEDEIKSLYDEEAINQDKYGKEMHLWPAFPSGGLSTVWLKSETGHEGTLFDFKNGEFRPLYKSKSGRMTVRLVRGEMPK
ncbi:MAG: DUF1566 domain-containing protein [Nitrospinae bacterium]|nr:DUF1566 domain-containing protein [Nitrospinota bacterium]